MKLVLWGVGRRMEKYFDFNYFGGHEILLVVDTYKVGEKWNDYTIAHPQKVLEMEYDYLIVATQFFSEIYDFCIKMGVDREKIILTDYIEDVYMKQDLDIIKSISEKLYNDVRMRHFRCINLNEKDDFENDKIVGCGKFSSDEYMRDYFRYRTAEFVIDEIYNNNIKGNVAELGVFRGVFSAFLNEKLMDRKLFLFDTFEGFCEDECVFERQEGRSNEEFEYSHKKTSVEIMLSNMPHADNCVVYKGLFPESIDDQVEKEVFSFVSIDVDFEKSIYDGIEFFYPRLSDGGYLFIHDYNSQFLDGVKKAVDDYEKNNGIKLKKVPLADRAGTLVVMK